MRARNYSLRSTLEKNPTIGWFVGFSARNRSVTASAFELSR
jgi:hypothetical protein